MHISLRDFDPGLAPRTGGKNPSLIVCVNAMLNFFCRQRVFPPSSFDCKVRDNIQIFLKVRSCLCCRRRIIQLEPALKDRWMEAEEEGSERQRETAPPRSVHSSQKKRERERERSLQF